MLNLSAQKVLSKLRKINKSNKIQANEVSPPLENNFWAMISMSCFIWIYSKLQNTNIYTVDLLRNNRKVHQNHWSSFKEHIIRLKQKEWNSYSYLIWREEHRRDVTGTKCLCYPLPVPQQSWRRETFSSAASGRVNAMLWHHANYGPASQGLLKTMDSVGCFHLIWVSSEVLLIENLQYV